MIETFRNALKIPELRGKLIFTMIILLLYRLGASIPVPFIDPEGLRELFSGVGDTIFGMINILSGSAFSQATLFALGISPYITASIVMQLLSIAVPALEKLQKSGEDGRKKITQITRYLTVALGLVTGFGYYMTLRSQNIVLDQNRVLFVGIVIVACYTAGSSLIMWLGERINENGIGNGISMILFANIISTLPSWITNMIYNIHQTIVLESYGAADVIGEIVKALVFIAAAIATLAFVVFFSNAERRLPVQYSKRMVGRKMYGGQSTYLPMKVNMSGVMPIIFASSMVSVPATIIGFINPNPSVDLNPVLYHISNLFGTRSPLYMILNFALIIAFSYFYIAISFNPVEVSNNLKKNGGFIPGIRPGKPTTDYITRILNKIVLIGGLFLGVVAVFPLAANSIISLINQSWSMGMIAFAGSSLLIVVGVALETTREIEAQMTMRHYKGFLE
ncbi:MAG: preprotein translocase subunit SecY [Oscillospiraceae bacterium]|nr:preprotein translocase subunit SecY [Oscillospiraceae bacterium]